jgi:protein disulfide-isomerase A1
MRLFHLLFPCVFGFRIFNPIPIDSDKVDEIMEGKNPYVKALGADDFEPFVSTPNQVSAVMFIAPWCFICPVLLPMWADAGKLLQSTETDFKVGLGVIDVISNPLVGEQNNIHAFPTMKIFVDQEVFIYTHESVQVPFSPSVVVNWVNRHTNRSTQITSEAQLGDFLKAYHLVLIGIFEEPVEAFRHSCLHFEDVFCLTMKPSFAPSLAKLTQKPVITKFPSVVIVYDHDDKYALFNGDLTQEGIDRFVRGRRLLTVNVFQQGTIDYIMDSGLPMMYMISPGSASDDEKNIFRQIAEKFIGKVVAVTSGLKEPWEQRLAEILDVRETTSTVVRILMHPPSEHHDHDPVSQSQSVIRHGLKYRNPEGDSLSADSLTKFVQLFVEGKIKPYIKSEPEDPDTIYTPGSILVNAVGTNFDKLVTDDIDRDILTIFHAPWCGHCRRLMPTIRELGEKLWYTGRQLKVAKIDATRNEIPHINISGYPTVILFKRVEKQVPIHERQAVVYNGDRSVEDFVRFLYENAVNKFSLEAPAKEVSGNQNIPFMEEL